MCLLLGRGLKLRMFLLFMSCVFVGSGLVRVKLGSGCWLFRISCMW